MSRLVFMRILSEVLDRTGLEVSLGDGDRDQLYQELLYYFGLTGGMSVCEALEAAWQDPYNRREIEKFIMAWLKKKAKKRMEAPAGVV